MRRQIPWPEVTVITLISALLALLVWAVYDSATSRWTVTVPDQAVDSTVYLHAHKPSHPISGYVPITTMIPSGDHGFIVSTSQHPVYDTNRWQFTTAEGEVVNVSGNLKYTREESND